MKKFLSMSVIFVSFFVLQANFVSAHEAYVTPHKSYVKPHSGYTTVSKKTARTQSVSSSAKTVNVYRPVYRQTGAVVPSGVNFISRDIGTGEVKQVVQVAPPPAYVGGYYY